MEHTCSCAQPAGQPAALGDILTAILPQPDRLGRQTSRIRGPLHRAVYGAIYAAGRQITAWDVKQALKRSGWPSVDAGSVRRCLDDLGTAGLVQFVGTGYQIRNGGRQ